MKKIALLSISLIFILFSCQKSKITNTKQTPNISLGKYKGTGKYDNADHSACPKGDGNCLDEVIVRPRVYDYIIAAVNNGTIGSLLNTDTEAYYDMTNGKDSLTISYVDGVKDGTYNMAIFDDGHVAANHIVLIIGSGTVNAENYDVDYIMTK